MRDNMRKGDFEHSNEESNGNSSDEEENQLPMSGRKGDDENLNETRRSSDLEVRLYKIRINDLSSLFVCNPKEELAFQ